MKRKKYEEKFDVDVTDDPSTGTTNVKDREKDEVSMLVEKHKNYRSISLSGPGLKRNDLKIIFFVD